MCSRHQPVEGADSGDHEEVIAFIHTQDEPIQVQCGTWIENEQYEGFCTLAPDHEGRCQPPRFVLGAMQ